MRLLVKDDNDVARGDAGLLVTLAREGDLLAVVHTLVNVHLEHLLLLANLLALARLAAVLKMSKTTTTKKEI